jgi:putative nucleotidyltransferase with HDIG domain
MKKRRRVHGTRRLYTNWLPPLHSLWRSLTRGISTRLWITDDSTALPGLAAANHCGASRKTSKRVAHLKNSQLRGLTAGPAYTPFEGCARLLKQFRAQEPADLRAVSWAAFLYVLAAGAGWALVRGDHDLPPIWALAVLAGLAAVAERQSVAVTERIDASVSFLPLVFAAVAFGPLAGFITGAISNATDVRRPYLRWVVYTPVRALTGAIAGFAAMAVSSVGSGLGNYLLASSVACVAELTADAVFNSATLAVRRTGTVLSFVQAVAPFFLFSIPLYAPLVALFVFGYHAYSLWVVIAFFIPVLALQRSIHLYQQQRGATRDLEAANARLKSANLSFATALVATLDARDRYTAGHSAAVAIYARDIAKRMGLSEEEQSLVHQCGLVHDVGKIGLPAGLLEKPGALSLEERRQMETHSEIGEQILRKVDDYGEIADVVRHHHERVDGLGYPDGLHGADIPQLARIIAVADAYNAMTSDRPYRDALPSRVARLRLAQAVESQFDTSVVAAFEAILASANEEYRMGRAEGFVLEGSADEALPAPRTAIASVAALT